MPVPANKLLADFIDIYDRNLSHTYKRQTPKVRAAFNKLRRSVGKAELKDDLSTRTGVEDPVVTYFTADTTTNPAVVSFPTSGLKGISFANGSSFTSGSWNIPQNGKVSFNYVQDVFQDTFYPVSLQLTAAAAANTTVTLKVNDVDLLTPDYPISQAVGTTVGVFDFFVPAPCFLGGTNTFTLTTTAGFISNITKIEVVSATGTGDVNATITALSQTLARLGAENGVIKNAWPQIVSTCQSFPQLASFVSRAQTLQSDFNTLYSNMKQSAIDLKSFCDMYYTLYLPILIDPDTSRQDKLDVVADAQQSVTNAKGTTLATITSLSNYKTRLQTFQTDIQNAATAANTQIQQALNDIAWQITQCRIELSGLQTRFNVTAAALGLTFFAGAVGVWASLTFLGPLGPFVAIGVAIVAVIGIAVSVGFLIDLGIQINDKQSELSDLLEDQADLIAQQQQIQQMMGKVTDISQSLVQVSQYTNAFKELWEFIETQLVSVETQFNNFPTINNPKLFQMYVDRWTNTMEPYFTKIITVLDAYINNFP